MDHPSFTHRIAHDEAFGREIETTISPLWEQDLADREFCMEGVKDWTQTLQLPLLP